MKSLIDIFYLGNQPNIIESIMQRKSNSEKYPEAWEFFIEHARNMENEPECKLGKYRIPKPDLSGQFLYHDRVEMLFQIFKDEFYKPSLNSPSIYGKIQYIVETFK
jgi:hypothetical protein